MSQLEGTCLKWNPNLADIYCESFPFPLDIPADCDSLDELSTIMIKAIEDIARVLGMYMNPQKKRETLSKPWFDVECKTAKRQVRQGLRNCRMSSFSPDSIELYINLKNSYKKLLIEEKAFQKTEILDKLASTRDSGSFW